MLHLATGVLKAARFARLANLNSDCLYFTINGLPAGVSEICMPERSRYVKLVYQLHSGQGCARDLVRGTRGCSV